jgi:uncharacterized membrane protein YkvA (DUF1232 family)
MFRWFLVGLAAAFVLWLLLVAVLVLSGRRGHVRALVRLVRDPRLSRTDRVAIVAVLAYLALPFDLVPDFIPVAGQLDDAIIVALLIRRLRRTITPAVVREHWPGPAESVEFLLRTP